MTPEGFFCLRTPMLPQEHLTRLTAEALRELLSNRVVREAILLASPSLDAELGQWQQRPDAEPGDRVLHACFKYLTRMAARPTPFGLFATVASGVIGRETCLTVSAVDKVRRRTRLDHEYLFKLCQSLNDRGEIPDAICYHPNPTILRLPDSIRFIERRTAGKAHGHHLVEVERTPALDLVLSASAEGAIFAQLIAELVAAGHAACPATRFVRQLIQSQTLVSSLGVVVSGSSALAELLRQAEGISQLREVTAVLTEVQASLESLDRPALDNSPTRYAAIAHSLDPLGVEVEPHRLFQVDSARDACGTLSEQVAREVSAGVDLLHRVGSARRVDPLVDFTRAFAERYEGRSVPLLEALDADLGIGDVLWPSSESSPLVAQLPLTPTRLSEVPWGTRERCLLRGVSEHPSAQAIEWCLSEEDIADLAVDQLPLPECGAAVVTVAAGGAAAMDRGEFLLHLGHFVGPSGARLLGRFCEADPDLEGLVERHLRWEESRDPSAIFAEVVHLPEGRVGNVACRPTLRDYDLIISGRSALPIERQIPVSDLVLSLLDDRLVLYSQRLGLRVVPRLTSAHNYATGLAIYRFLALLQGQGTSGGLAWSWGPLADALFLPRVRHGRIVLALATWRIQAQEIRDLRGANASERLPAAQCLRARRGLPRWVVLVDGDHRLPVDLDNPLAVDAFIEELDPKGDAILEELWPELGPSVVHGPEGTYRHEVVMPLRSTQERERPSPIAHANRSIPRRFAPGSEWLYLKLYLPSQAADLVLKEVIGPVSRAWCRTGPGRRWHFLRYADPEPHLRWRLSGEPDELLEELWPSVRQALEPFLSRGQLRRLQFDTYEREVERYGGPDAIHLAEALFCHDSDAVIDILDALAPGDAALDERWRLALRGIDDLLIAFGLDLPARLRLLERNSKYGSIPEPDAALRRQLSTRFRERRGSLEALLAAGPGSEHPLQAGIAILSERSTAMRWAIERLKAISQHDGLQTSVADIAGSLVHMQVNRLMAGAANAHETVIYDWLRRLYRSQMARCSPLTPNGEHHDRAEQPDPEALEAIGGA